MARSLFAAMLLFAAGTALASLVSLESSARLALPVSAATLDPAVVTDSPPVAATVVLEAPAPSPESALPESSNLTAASADPLAYAAGDIQSAPEPAADLLTGMNAVREANGSQPLTPDALLEEVAVARANQLVTGGYFAHYGPDGESAFSELAARGIEYGLAGENLARNNYGAGTTIQVAFEGLMASPSHRENILEPRYSRVGVAAVRSGQVWLYVIIFSD